MSRLTVIMPSENRILSKSYTQLVDLATDAQLPYSGTIEQKLRRLLVTCRRIFDGRHFNIPRAELVELHDQIFGPIDLSLKSTDKIAHMVAVYFWPGGGGSDVITTETGSTITTETGSDITIE